MLWALATIISNTVAQILLKIGSKPIDVGSPVSYVNIHNFLAALFYCIGLVFWMNALRALPLSAAYPLLGLVMLAVNVGSIVVLRETISLNQWFAMFVILTGIVLYFMASTNR